MKIFVCKTGGCHCHPKGMSIALAFNRGHAVKLLNKRMEAAGYEALPKDDKHVVEEIDSEDHKKGYAEIGWD